MSKRVSVTDRLSKKDTKPVDKLFQPTSGKKKDKTSDTPITQGSQQLRRQTYYIPEVMIDAIGFKKVTEDKDISEIVRDALEKHIEDKYIQMAKEKYKEK